MKKLAFILLICILLMICCQPRNSSKKRLKQRVNEYYTYFIKGEYDLSWDLLCQNAKRKRYKDEWAKFAREYDARKRLIEFHVKSVSIYEVQNHILGKVNLFGKNWDLKKNQAEKFEGNEDWIYENEDWYRYVE